MSGDCSSRNKQNNLLEPMHLPRIISVQWFLIGCIGLVAIRSVVSFYMFLNHSGRDSERQDSLGTMPVRIIQHNDIVPPLSEPTVKAPGEEGGVTVGFAITVTGCGEDSITEGAAVLKHSIHLASVHGNLGGRYDYKMYAIYHPDSEPCALQLQELGYALVRRETPVKVQDIEGEFLRRNIETNGCCGEKELVKLEAYTLIEHPIVVHFDLDVLVLQPLDTLFDWMLLDQKEFKMENDTSNVPEQEKPTKVNAFFTRDYNMAIVTSKYKPVQGGFLVLRPDMNVYHEFVSLIKKGDFREGSGWGGFLGSFYGGMTFQGIIPYYYDVLHPGNSIELNRCVYNQMADNPRDEPTIDDVVKGRCRTGQAVCEDCRDRPITDIVTTHFTLCQKPWLCLPHDHNITQHRLCRKMHHEWNRVRADLELSWGREYLGSGAFQREHFYGHCSKRGKEGYLPIKQPYGPLNSLQTTLQ